MSTVEFVKMHGLGNDFIVVDCLRHSYNVEQLIEQAAWLCDRHFGIGGDGLILALPSTTGDFRMRIINSDGSEPEMCGNGIRCFAKYVYEHGLTERTTFVVETLAGPITPVLAVADGRVTGVCVDMGEPRLERSEIPMFGPAGQVVDEPLTIDHQTLHVTAVSMGNPHAIFFVSELASYPVAAVGAQIETHAVFPKKTNVEFVEVVSPSYLKMRVWERGAGITLACGTGACATLVAAVLTGNAERTATVELPGGPLKITWSDEDNHIYMTGPAEEVFSGEIPLR
ncbi:MAG TPA: diaminopimelate epimerase [Armatimonadota bacterium]|jgi:diaminopimelate epimerase